MHHHNHPLSLEDARTLGLLEGPSEEGLTWLKDRLGEPTGPDGIPKKTCTMASMRAMSHGSGMHGESVWGALADLIHLLRDTLLLTGLDTWLFILFRPLRIRLLARHTGLPRAELKQLDRIEVTLTYNSPFLKFYRRQRLASGVAVLLISASTCFIGTLVLLPLYFLKRFSILEAVERGEWEPALFVGDFIMRRTRPLRSYQRAAGVLPTNEEGPQNTPPSPPKPGVI